MTPLWDAYVTLVFAGRFASEKMLFDEKDIESEEKIIDRITESFPAALRDCIRKKAFCNGIYFPRLLKLLDQKNAEWGWEEYIRGIYEHCCSISDYAKDCRLCLTKLSDQDFDEINVLFESVKDVDRLWEIDKLKEEKERVSHELDGKKIELEKLKKRQKRLSEIAIDIKYDESGEIVSAMPKEKKYEYEADISRLLYNDHRFVLVEVEKLRNRKTSLEAEITEYEAKTHIKDRKLTKGIFAFRKYNACLRFFFFTSTLLINMP